MMQQRELKIWALYDAGLAAFNTLVMTFIFAVYVTHTLAPANGMDSATGTTRWGTMLTLAGLAVLLLSPIAGMITQRAPAWFLRALTALVMLGTGLLFFATPGTPLWLALLCAGLATVAYELTFIPYSARLAQLAAPQSIARWSGYGWAAGYAGGIIVLGLALWLLVGEQSPLAQLLGTEQSLNIRASAVLAVIWIGILCLPLLLRPAPAAPITKEHGFLSAWRACALQPDLLRFIIASALYRDGLATIFGFGGIYAATVHGFAFKDILIFGIALNLGSGIGAALFARLDTLFKPLTVIRISLIGLTISGALVLLAPTVTLFWIAAILLSLWFGPAQSAGRAHLLIEAGAEQAAPALSLYTVTGRAANFIGPALYGAAVAATGLQQAGMGSVLLLFIAAACVLGLSPAKAQLMTVR